MPLKRVLYFALILSFLPFSAHAQSDEKKVLLLHSYHPEYPWVESITKGAMSVLENEENIDVEIHYMDTKRNTSLEFFAEAGRIARGMIETWQPDVVIASDDNAQKYVTQWYAGKEKPYFVFCGLNGSPEDYNIVTDNVTGILERPHFIDSFDYLKSLIPYPRRIAIMSDKGPTSIGALEHMREKAPEIDVKVLDYRLINDFDLWKKRIKEYNYDVDALFIYMYHTVKEKGGPISLEPKKVMKWTRENCDIPMVGFFEFSIEDGMLCGIVESGFEHGFEAAKVAKALTMGADIADYPIKTAKEGIEMINLDAVQRLGLTVPEETLSTAKTVKDSSL